MLLPLHVRNGGLRQPERRLEIDVERGLKLFLVKLFKARPRAASGIVDQNVEPPTLFGNGIDKLGQFGAAGAGQGEGLCVEPARRSGLQPR